MAHPDTCPTSFTYPPVASTWVIALHSLFLYSDLPLPRHPPPYWLRLFSSQTFSLINTPTFSTPVILNTYPPMKMEQTECSEMLAYKIRTPGNYPEESIQQNRFISYPTHSAWPWGPPKLLLSLYLGLFLQG
jgi:hypothetical protein